MEGSGGAKEVMYSCWVVSECMIEESAVIGVDMSCCGRVHNTSRNVTFSTCHEGKVKVD